jgi:hypothetical protein
MAYEEWLNKENKRMQDLRKQMREEKGIKDLLSLKKGENLITIDKTIAPKFVTTKYGDRYVFDLKEPENLSFMCSVYLYAEILAYITAKDTYSIKILRSGEGGETKIEIIN